MDNYYSPERVHFWLDRYVDLETAVHYSCSLDANPSTGETNSSAVAMKHRIQTGLDTDLLVIKCDIDKAISALPPKHKQLIELMYKEQWTFREIAVKMKVGQSKVLQIKNDSFLLMSCYLGYPVEEIKAKYGI